MTHKQWEANRKGLGILFLPLVLLVCGLVIIGCESDSVAPDDDPPELTEMEAAQQAGLVATAISKVAPELLNFSGPKAVSKDLGFYSYDFPEGGDITGTILLEYTAGGVPSDWNDADHGSLYTAEGTVLEVAVDLGGGLEVGFQLTFDLQGDIDQEADTATVSGGGTINFGSGSDDFTIPVEDPVVLSGVSDYPEGGMVMFSVDGIDMLVIYDGDHTAGVVIDEIVAFMIDLDTAIVTPVI